MRLEVRLGDTADIDGAAKVWARATAKRDGEAEVPPLAAARAVVVNRLQEERSIFVVAANESGVVGFAIAAPAASVRRAEVHYVGVDPEHWGGGVGVAVMTRLAGELTSAGFASAQLLVYADNVAARRLYERVGWIWDGREPTIHPRSGRPEVRYRLRLEPR